jgi:hypothetical protein
MAGPAEIQAGSGARECESQLVGVLTVAGGGATFVLAVLSLKLGVTPFALWVKLVVFGGACVLSVSSVGLALWTMRKPDELGSERYRPEKQDAHDESEPSNKPEKHQGAEPEDQQGGETEGTAKESSDEEQRGPERGPVRMRHRPVSTAALGALVGAMLMSAASAVGKVPEPNPKRSISPNAAAVTIAPHVDFRGAKLQLNASGVRASAQAASLLRSALSGALGEVFKEVTTLGGGVLREFLKAGITLAPNIYFGGGGTGLNRQSLNELVSAIEKAHLNFALNGGVDTEADCAHYYLELDQLADDEPQIARELPATTADPSARRCGVGDRQRLARFLAYLARH